MEMRSYLNNKGTRKNSMGLAVIVVAKDGTWDSETLQGAIDMVLADNAHRKTKPYISLIGIEPNKTLLTWNAKASDKDEHGKEIGTVKTATVDVGSDYFCANGVTFQNTIVAKPGVEGMKVVALRITGDRAVFYNVRFLGYQDTLYDHEGVHYYYNCFIEGAVDFIFGNGRSLFENYTLNSIAQGIGFIAASHRNLVEDNTGVLFLELENHWNWKNILGKSMGTVMFGEFQCSDEGSYTTERVQWSKLFTQEEIHPFEDKLYIDEQEWLGL
ncbi:hypothetical protein MKW98_028815 [Papaver atlanticum]|uniref:Pectinesterase n=1 Tax=Papaver atlanticum TaxID=357466 RepID=A0AAD4SAW8_9MAGN|nr:hypothetical protein MKW98_028815 [Papaver atlanticum]